MLQMTPLPYPSVLSVSLMPRATPILPMGLERIPSAGEMLPPISVPRIFGLGTVLRSWQLFLNFERNSTTGSIFKHGFTQIQAYTSAYN
jgi:hypothetical protein